MDDLIRKAEVDLLDDLIRNAEVDLFHIANELDRAKSEHARIAAYLSRLKSIRFIQVNQITKDDVITSYDDKPGRPWFGELQTFGRWIANEKHMHRFCEWNGDILFSSDVISGLLKRTEGRYEHIESPTEGSAAS